MNSLKPFHIFCLFLISFFTFVRTEAPKIVIIGAGAAGISAAVELIENGITDVTILEAEDKIGGRIRTEKIGDDVIDMGAQWVAGEQGNWIWEEAWPLNLLEHSNDSYNTFQFFTSDGQQVDIDKAKELTEHFRIIFMNELQNNNNETVGYIGNSELDKYFEEHPDLGLRKEFTHWIEEMIKSTEFSDSWNEIILDNSEWGVGGDWAMNWKDKGFSMILDIMMKKYPDPSKEIPVIEKVKFNKDVINIDYSNEGEKVKIKTKDQEIIEADDVIVTVSLGVLKANHETIFNPPLPDIKKKVIENLGYGDITKIFLIYEKPWWNIDPRTNGFSILWNDKDIELRQYNLEKEWQLNLLGFFKPEHRNNILEMWVNGKGARDVELIRNEEMINQVVELMTIFKNDKTVEKPKNKIGFVGEATDPQFYASVTGAINSGRREAKKILEKYGKNEIN